MKVGRWNSLVDFMRFLLQLSDIEGYISVRRRNAFKHLIRSFRFLVVQVRCDKRQDTVGQTWYTQHTIDTTQIFRCDLNLKE